VVDLLLYRCLVDLQVSPTRDETKEFINIFCRHFDSQTNTKAQKSFVFWGFAVVSLLLSTPFLTCAFIQSPQVENFTAWFFISVISLLLIADGFFLTSTAIKIFKLSLMKKIVSHHTGYQREKKR
jgi:cobalamin biosynthesis protein CobD/CbiB